MYIMNFKTCIKCNSSKHIDDFYNRNKEKDGKSKHCKQCAIKINRKGYYEKYKEKHNINIIERRIKKKTEFDNYIKSLGLKCKECGINHPAVLDFHHINPNDKKYTISYLKWSGCSFETIKKEIDKCDILCSNCHRIFHYNKK